MNSNFIAYLNLLGIYKIEKPTYEFLKKIHKSHIETIAYSNLDFLFQIGVNFEIEAIITKFMTKHRSGICYELNYAFSELLKYLGYEVRLVYANLPKTGHIIFQHSEIAHMVGLVYLNDTTYLIDVGFSHWFRHPIDLYHSNYQDISGHYRITTSDNVKFCLESNVKNKYEFKYSFNLNNHFVKPKRLDYSLDEAMLYPNLYGEFRYSLPNSNGCKTILNTDFIETGIDGIKITTIDHKEALLDILIHNMEIEKSFAASLPQLGFDALFLSHTI
ncbi:arylamine N-acetyltransferase [bacterium]|nr:arylamine N-acetyltransferase [bacterium]